MLPLQAHLLRYGTGHGRFRCSLFGMHAVWGYISSLCALGCIPCLHTSLRHPLPLPTSIYYIFILFTVNIFAQCSSTNPLPSNCRRCCYEKSFLYFGYFTLYGMLYFPIFRMFGSGGGGGGWNASRGLALALASIVWRFC